MSNFFVTEDGFNKKTLVEIKVELENLFKNIWGDDIDLDPRGPIGQLVSALAKRDANIWDGAEEIYFSRDPRSATGISLDNILLENGTIRLSASYTTVKDVILLGDESTVIAAGKLCKNTNQSVQYALDSAVTIDKTIAREGRIECASVSVGDHYIVTIDSVAYDYTAIGGDEPVDVLDGIAALIDAGSWTGDVSVNETTLQLILFHTEDFSFDVNANLDIESIGNIGDFTCTTTGYNTLPAESLTTIVTSVSGWLYVHNPDVGDPGRNVESNEDARLRRESSVQNGAATDDAIREAILNEVENVVSCSVASNRSDVIDIEGRPPHSFECVVSGGLDADVAAVILSKQGAGCESYGNTTVVAYDSEGYPHTIKFSRAVSKYIWVRVSRSLYSEEDYPDDGDTEIKNEIVAWSLINSNITVGKDVIRGRINNPIYTVPGIEDVLIELASTDTPSGSPIYAESNIEISARELAIFAVERIIVQDLI